jgi:hypothetical protein
MPTLVADQGLPKALPTGHWKILTILSALSLRGRLATTTIDEATDGRIFLAYVEPVLCPALHRPTWWSWTTLAPRR